MSNAVYESLTTVPVVRAKWRVGRFDTLTDVSRAVGGYVSVSDAKKMMPLLNALDKAGYVRSDGRLIDRIKIDDDVNGFVPNRTNLRAYIRGVAVTDSSR